MQVKSLRAAKCECPALFIPKVAGHSVSVEPKLCTAIGNLDHSLNQDCATLTIYLKGEFRWRNEEDLPLSLKRKLCLRHSTVKVPKRNCGVLRHNLSADQLSKWKQQVVENVATLFDSTDKHSDASIERIAQLEQLVGRLTLALEIQKKASTLLS